MSAVHLRPCSHLNHPQDKNNQPDNKSLEIYSIVRKYKLIQACLSSPIDPLSGRKISVSSRKRERFLQTDPSNGFTAERLEKAYISDGTQIFPSLKFFEKYNYKMPVVDYFASLNEEQCKPLFKPFEDEVNTEVAFSSSPSIESTVKPQRKRKREDVDLEDRHIHKERKKGRFEARGSEKTTNTSTSK